MTLHCIAARGGIYYFASAVDPSGGLTVWLVAWLGWPLTWATIGHVDRDVRLDLLRLNVDPANLLINHLLV